MTEKETTQTEQKKGGLSQANLSEPQIRASQEEVDSAYASIAALVSRFTALNTQYFAEIVSAIHKENSSSMPSLPDADLMRIMRHHLFQTQPPFSSSIRAIGKPYWANLALSPNSATPSESHENTQKEEQEMDDATALAVMIELDSLNVATMESQDRTEALKLETRVIQQGIDHTLDNIEAILRGDVKVL